MHQKISYQATAFMLMATLLLAIAAWINYPHHIVAKLFSTPYEKIFTQIYEQNAYLSTEAPSEYQTLLQQYLADPEIHSIVALGCGAWQQSSQPFIPVTKTYICYDVVPEIIAANNAEYSQEHVHFYYIRNLRDFVVTTQDADLLIAKDFLQFWPNADIQYFLRKTASKFKQALFTNTISADVASLNLDQALGTTRALDLRGKPFNLGHTKVLLEYADSAQHEKLVLLYQQNFD